MSAWIRLGTLGIGVAATCGAILLAWTSYREGARRAVWIGLGGVLGGLLWIGVGTVAPSPLIEGMFWGAVAVLVGGAVWFFWPVSTEEVGPETPQTRVDERRIPFAWIRLRPGTPVWEQYYRIYPERKEVEDAIWELPGLLSPRARGAHPLAFAASEASFMLTAAVRHQVEGEVAERQVRLEPEVMTRFVKALARYYGAVDVGVTELRPYHVYSHIGRGTGEYGAPLEPEHRYAIAFTVEMRYEPMQTAPWAWTVMESAHQYVEAAKVALRLAYVIRLLGYPARAHIDGNYRVIAPLVARDAGLGELGRMGLLITPRLGPRVRLGVVTTDLPLVPTPRVPDASVVDMCQHCKKCAVNCPGRAIPMGEREMVDGALRWRIDIDRCFRYWNVIGTDCGRCIAVCPYAHPDTLLHNLVRAAIRRSGTMRRAAAWFDDLLYGRKPPIHPLPSWLPRR